MEDHKDHPFFLYLALTIPHANNEGSRMTGDGAELRLSNPEGLRGVAVSLPASRWSADAPAGCRRIADETETILVVTEDLDEIAIPASLR